MIWNVNKFSDHSSHLETPPGCIGTPF
jgi:hypothetical protein